MPDQRLTIRGLTGRAVNVPMNRPVHTSGGAVTSAPLVLVDLETSQGVTGRAYVFCYTPLMLKPVVSLLEALAEILIGEPAAPAQLESKLRATFRLLDTPGLVALALSAIDMAAWDVHCKAAGQPLAVCLGGAPRPVPAYNSCGLGIIGPDRAGDEARELLDAGFSAVKLRLGYPTPEEDRVVVRAVRKAVGEQVVLPTDYNQSLPVAEAIRRAQCLDGEGVYWIEEPTRCDDYLGHARIREKSPLPIQLGENCWGPRDMQKALDAGSGDYFMIDVGKSGGVTGWMRGAALAEPPGLPVSSHLYPEVSAHLLCLTPTAHWLEYVDWANPLLAEPLAIKDGHALPSTAPGIGIAWDEQGIARCLA